MSLSISSSEPADSHWRGFLATFAATTALLFAAMLALLASLDPYDTGRVALVERKGVAQQGPRTANASRGRDPSFDSAIFGNSHVWLLRPETLKAQTGLDFVSLIVPATYPREQFVLIDWFLRHHPRPAALIIGLDAGWCMDSLFSDKPFPFWLYDQNPLTYLAGLIRFSALEHIPGRLALLVGKARLARPDGYHDWDAEYRKLDLVALRAQLALARPTTSNNPRNFFLAAERLRDALAVVPSSTRVVLVWPPVHISAQPEPGSAAEATMRACHAAFSLLAAKRPRTAVVDWAVDRTENRQAENFFDQTHYLLVLAESLQKDVAAALNAIGENR